jgi:hypothetical protein
MGWFIFLAQLADNALVNRHSENANVQKTADGQSHNDYEYIGAENKNCIAILQPEKWFIKLIENFRHICLPHLNIFY